MLLCLVIQVALSFWAVRYYIRHAWGTPAPSRFLAGIRPLLVIMLAMTAGNFVQIAVWGILFVLLGEFDELYEAVYHSAVNFASLGYGDIVMSKPWKLLGPLEAVNGVLMVGMTAAALMVILQQLVKAQRDSLAEDESGPRTTRDFTDS
jgi:hypothetical protein